MSDQKDDKSVPKERTFVIDGFCMRQFNDPKFKGTKVLYDKEAFEDQINTLYTTEGDKYPLVDGYAPFCKHLLIPNFTNTRLNDIEITQRNEKLLCCGYHARTPLELPVLTRWFPSHSVISPVAKYLDIIVYTREQIEIEDQAMNVNKESRETAPWGIIAIKAQDVPYELPMSPITMLRNSLGPEHGGSGVPLDKEKYLQAVDYWKQHATIQNPNTLEQC